MSNRGGDDSNYSDLSPRAALGRLCHTLPLPLSLPLFLSLSPTLFLSPWHVPVTISLSPSICHHLSIKCQSRSILHNGPRAGWITMVVWTHITSLVLCVTVFCVTAARTNPFSPFQIADSYTEVYESMFRRIWNQI